MDRQPLAGAESGRLQLDHAFRVSPEGSNDLRPGANNQISSAQARPWKITHDQPAIAMATTAR